MFRGNNRLGNNRPVVLTIAGLDPSGGAGVLADVRTIAAFDCFPVAALTSITYQNTERVFGAVHQSALVLRNQISPIIEDFDIAAVKTGMLPTAEIVLEVARLCSDGKLPNPVLDPVMVSTSGADLIEDAAFESLIRALLPLARLATPNIPEAERLAGFSIKNEADIKRAAKAIRDLGARAVLVKGGHRVAAIGDQDKGYAVDVLLDEQGTFTEYRADFCEIGKVHGSGCVLSAAVTACLAKGISLPEAIHNAKQFVTKAIRESQQLGSGARPLFGVC